MSLSSCWDYDNIVNVTKIFLHKRTTGSLEGCCSVMINMVHSFHCKTSNSLANAFWFSSSLRIEICQKTLVRFKHHRFLSGRDTERSAEAKNFCGSLCVHVFDVTTLVAVLLKPDNSTSPLYSYSSIRSPCYGTALWQKSIWWTIMLHLPMNGSTW